MFNESPSFRLTGAEAIKYAEKHGYALSKETVRGHRPISIEEARAFVTKFPRKSEAVWIGILDHGITVPKPGEWRAVWGISKGLLQEEQWNIASPEELPLDDYVMIADLSCSDGFLSHNQVAFNARLISKLPELLAIASAISDRDAWEKIPLDVTEMADEVIEFLRDMTRPDPEQKK